MAAQSSSVINRPRESQWPAIPMAEALSLVETEFSKHLDTLRRTKTVPWSGVKECDVLAESVHAIQPLPPYRASIKDGYAVIAADGAGPRRVIGTSTADKSAARVAIAPGECCRINTGAALPDGADAVVQVEDTRLAEHDGSEELVVEILTAPRLEQDIREVGSDVAKGELLIEAATRLQPAHLGLLALSQLREVAIYEPIHVAVMSTGDELSDESIAEQGQSAIRDTNRPVLISLLRSNGFEVVDVGIVVDEKPTLIAAMERALASCPVLIVTGGVSMGERDYLKELLTQHFRYTIHFGRVWMKPGLPTTFASSAGNNKGSFVFGLPGNPVSAFVTAHLFAIPQLRRVSGWADYEFPRLRVKLADGVALDKRPEYRRAIFVQGEEGLPMAVCVPGSQISSRLLSTRSANLLLELPGRDQPAKERIEKGDWVTALVIGLI